MRESRTTSDIATARFERKSIPVAISADIIRFADIMLIEKIWNKAPMYKYDRRRDPKIGTLSDKNP